MTEAYCGTSYPSPAKRGRGKKDTIQSWFCRSSKLTSIRHPLVFPSSLFLTIAANLQVRRCWQSFNFQKENKNSKGVHALCLGLYRVFSEVPCTAGHLRPSDQTSMQMQIVLESSAFTCTQGQSKSSATNRQENRHEETASGACFSS